MRKGKYLKIQKKIFENTKDNFRKPQKNES